MSYPGSFDSLPNVSTGQLITSSGTNGQINAVNAIESALGLNPARGLCEGRLTLTTGVPVTSSDVVGATTIYYTTYLGNRIALYDGVSNWSVFALSADLSIALGTLTSGLPYDVFCYNNAGTPTLEIDAWSSSTARATALVYQDGIYVKSGVTTRRWLGTFLTTSATTTEDSAANRFLFNANNQVPRALNRPDSTRTTTYTSLTELNASGKTCRGSFINGSPHTITVWAGAYAAYVGDSTAASIFIAVGSGTTGGATAAYEMGISAPTTGYSYTLLAPMVPLSGMASGLNYFTVMAAVSTGTGSFNSPQSVGWLNA